VDLTVRVASGSDIDAVTATIASSFFHDPVWSWVFPDPATRTDVYARWWPMFVRGALQNSWLLVTQDCESIALWLPPDAEEFTPQDAALIDDDLESIVGDRAGVVRSTFAAFEQAHPVGDPHYYLSVLGTHTHHRGQGLGMRLLAENLGRTDALAVPTYLESTNPVNLDRYRSVGFVSTGEFVLPGGGPVVTTMWRPVGG